MLKKYYLYILVIFVFILAPTGVIFAKDSILDIPGKAKEKVKAFNENYQEMMDEAGIDEEEYEEENENEYENENEEEENNEENASTTSGSATGTASEINDDEFDGPNSRALQRRSQVANAVHELLQAADRDGGIGEQVREVARNQNQNFIEAEGYLERAKNRNKFVRFLVGPDYYEIKRVRVKLDNIEENLSRFDSLLGNVEDPELQNQIEKHMGELEDIKTQLEQDVEDSQKGFSLFGWLTKLFMR